MNRHAEADRLTLAIWPETVKRGQPTHTSREADRIDAANTRDWLRLRKLGISWSRLAIADYKALESIDLLAERIQ